MYHVLKPYLNDGCQFWDYLKCKYCDFSLLTRCKTPILHNILMGLNWHWSPITIIFQIYMYFKYKKFVRENEDILQYSGILFLSCAFGQPYVVCLVSKSVCFVFSCWDLPNYAHTPSLPLLMVVDSPWRVGLHWGGFAMFKPMLQELLNFE